MKLEIVEGYNYKNEVKTLFNEYINYLVNKDETIKEYMELQNYDEEINNLEYKYGLPYGRLFLLYIDNNLVGCLALRKMDDSSCEMKRLYVRSNYNNKGIGNILINKIIDEAKDIGYKYMYLDTMSFSLNAIELYKKNGFYFIDRYNNSPVEGTVFMRKDL